MTDAEFIHGLLARSNAALESRLHDSATSPPCAPWCGTTDKHELTSKAFVHRGALGDVHFCHALCLYWKTPVNPLPPCPDCGKATTSVVHRSVCLAPCRVASRGK